MSIPAHVAIIMDGAGRWATQRGLDRGEGHIQGIETAQHIIAAAHEAKIAYLTLFTFSLSSWERPRAEVQALMELLVRFADHQRDFCKSNGVRIHVIGHLDELQTKARHAVETLQSETQHGTSMVLTLALSYGGQADIAQAARSLAARARAGLVLPEEIDEKFLHRQMTTGELPPVDLLIRTGGERKLSDFLLYECAHAELVFLKEMWPEFTPERFREVLADYSQTRSMPPPSAGFDLPHRS